MLRADRDLGEGRLQDAADAVKSSLAELGAARLLLAGAALVGVAAVRGLVDRREAGHGADQPAPVEEMVGRGLGSPLPEEAARDRLDRLAVPAPVQDWAGPVERPAAMAESLGIARSTLDSWRQEGHFVALPRGRRAHVYPAHQFADGRPLDGIAGTLGAAGGSAAVAWRWLRTPHFDFEGMTPLEALRGGRADEVVEAARKSLA